LLALARLRQSPRGKEVEMVEMIEAEMERIGAVRVPPEDDDFERWLDEQSEYDPAVIGFWIEDGVTHYYPRVREEGCGCVLHRR
jgi:hypothetical protein